jgi:dihydroneopterin aldolase
VEANLKKAGISDKLEDTVNYQQVYDIVKREMEVPSKLLEHVAGRIVSSLHAELSGIESVAVKVYKMNPPLGGKVKYSAVQIVK